VKGLKAGSVNITATVTGTSIRDATPVSVK
jgi:hypothetical protein